MPDSSIYPAAEQTELLAPAGDLDCVRAAVENGADAVYFGLDRGFNARARATNISLENLPDLMALLHRRRVKGYLTLNTLVFSEELASFEKVVRQVAAAGVDAVLVQDLGVVRLIRTICPDVPIHASTQMTLTSAPCIAEVESLGVERVVLARELSIAEIARIHQQTSVPLEAFVHGALCVAYSGQCLTSESLGGRSANRGQCAQACRLPYELICDGHDVDLGQQKYLLSPQDLAAYELIPQLLDAGVRSLKIEGRLKTPEYVANITRHYRQALDQALRERAVHLSPQQVEEMELSFSRGFSPGWLNGCDHKMLVPALSSAKRGVLLGEITSLAKNRIHVRLQRSLRAGDGVVFDGDRARGHEQGGRVFQILRGAQPATGTVQQGIVELVFGRDAIDVRQLYVGQQVWKTDDPQLTRRLRQTFNGPRPRQKIAIELDVTAEVGKPLVLQARLGDQVVSRLTSKQPLQPAEKHPLSQELLQRQLGRLGNTAYLLQTVRLQMQGTPMVPLSVLGRLRHELVTQLDQHLGAAPCRVIASDSVLPRLRPPGASAADQPPRLHVLCRSLHQLEAVLESTAEVDQLMVDFQDIRHYRQAVPRARAAGYRILLATPRIQKPDEMGIFHALLRHQADGILVRNLAGLRFFADRQQLVVTDFSLNVTNELTARLLHERGAARITVSYDLNRDQVMQLVQATPADWLEVVVHQHMPMFHMEHCVFCAVLSPGTNKTNCGRPCDEHQVALRDRLGMQHPLQADVGCRNTLFNAQPQSAAEAVPSLLAGGVRHFRLEFLEDSPQQIGQTLSMYRQLLDGQISPSTVWQQLRAMNRVGVTRGTLEQRRDPLAII